MWLDLGQGDPVASVLMRREGRVSGEGEGGERREEDAGAAVSLSFFLT